MKFNIVKRSLYYTNLGDLLFVLYYPRTESSGRELVRRHVEHHQNEMEYRHLKRQVDFLFCLLFLKTHNNEFCCLCERYSLILLK